MPQDLSRRRLIQASAVGAAAIGLRKTRLIASESPGSVVRVAIMGAGGRGGDLAKTFGGQNGVEVAYVCDPDSQRAAALTKAVGEAGAKDVKAVADFRRALDDKNIDALVIAAPNHWHAPATILACDAGKHVYVEKPCSHNPREGELMIAAARRNNRCVQVGTQRRSSPALAEAMQKLHEGLIGRVYLARTYYTNVRGSIGHAEPSTPPTHLDFDLWQGPAPRKPFRENILHYNWHWFWDYGNGEAGNNGVHFIDVARWGLGVGNPVRVSSTGGRYHFEDDQQTPDTNVVTLEYDGDRMIRWECSSCVKFPTDDVAFHGTEGTLAIRGKTYSVTDRNGKPVSEGSGISAPTDTHVANFLNAIRDDSHTALTAEVEDANRSTLATELANISYRVGRTLVCEPTSGRIQNDDEAMRLWGREYAPGWAPRSA